ncbi:MAG: alkaline phosphatase [Terrimicrobiaceae bacterium]|nr:alkaline phosphatase [Terrimicrobiaceae bacterium]
MKSLRGFATAAAVVLANAGFVQLSQAQTDPGRVPVPSNRAFPTGNVIFFHPDGTGLNHWFAARLYFHGPDGMLHWDQLPNMAAYRGHMVNTLIGTSNGGATTHAFGYKVDGYGSFGKDGDGGVTPPTDIAINSLSGYQGSIMRQAANAGLPVGVVNDGHIGEPGTGCFLAEVGNRGNWQEITRQMIQGRPGFTDARPWVIMGGGEADTLPSGATVLHRNHNQERSQALNSTLSLRSDSLNLEADWDTQLVGGVASPANIVGNEGTPVGVISAASDNAIVIKTRAQFNALVTALNANPTYAPRVLGLFAFQDLFNDRNEEDLIGRSKITADPVNFVGPVNNSALGVRSKASRIILWGDVAGNPGHNPPTFAEMTDVAIRILDRAAKSQANAANRRFFLVAEQEANDNFGNNDNAIGMLHAMADTDKAIGVARNYLAANPRTLILTAADSDAGGMQVTAPYRDNIDGGPIEIAGTAIPGLINTSTNTSNPAFLNLGQFYFGFNSNNAQGSTNLPNVPDGLEGRGQSGTSGGTLMFLSEPDANNDRMEFAINWAGTGDYTGGIVSRAAGVNAGLLNSVFAARFDNIDVYRMMYVSLFGTLLNYPTVGTQAVAR